MGQDQSKDQSKTGTQGGNRSSRRRRRSKHKDAQLGNFDPDSIKAVMFDTNAFGEKGVLDFSLLDRWRLLAEGEDLEIWLPEPVVWEGAIHAAEHAEEHRAFLKKSASFLAKAGLPVPEVPKYRAPLDIALEIIDKVEELEHPIVVIPCDGDAAIEGLRDQILQRPPGTRGAGGDRTGAADSTLLRSVEAHAVANERPYAIVSDDSDIQAALADWKWERPMFRDQYAAANALFAYTPAPDNAVRQLLAFVRELLQQDEPKGLIDGVEVKPQDLEQLFGPTKAEIVREVDAEVVNFGPLVGLCEVEISRRGAWIRTCAAIRADVRITIWYDVEQESDIELASDWIEVYDGVLESCLLFDLKEDKIIGVQTEGPSTLNLPYSTFAEEEEVLSDVGYRFDWIYGLDGDEIYLALREKGEWEGYFLNRPLKLGTYEYYEKDADETQTRVEAHYEGDHAAVVWVYRPDWIAPQGFGNEDAYKLEPDFKTDVPAFPSWALPSWLLEKALSEPTAETSKEDK